MIRILKQLAYGSLYLAVILVFSAGIYIIVGRENPTCFDDIQNQSEEGVDCSGPCISCTLKNAKLEISQTAFIPAGTGRITILTKVENSVEVGAFFSYTIDVSSNFGGILTSVDGASFVGAMDIRYIVIPGLNINPSDAEEAIVKITNIEWDTDSVITKSLLLTQGVHVVIEDEEIRVVGELVNQSGEILNTVRITALLIDEEQDILSASAKTIKNVSVISSTPFTIFFPTIDGVTENTEQLHTMVFSEVVPSL